MQDLKVTLIQVDQVWEDKQANFNKYQHFFSLLEKADLIILPEMFHTGFSMSVEFLAEDWDNSEGLDFLKKWSAKLNTAIYTSLIIREELNYYNRGVFVYPNGSITHYNKRKSFGLGGEDNFYTAGDKEVIVEWKGWKINLQICYDLRFPEIARNFEVNNLARYDLLLYVANWPFKRSEHWKTLLRARSIENQSFVIGVNRFGEDANGLFYSGDSSCFDPIGNNQCQLYGESFITTNLSMNTLKSTRTSLPFLKDF
jgi:predicted amidohydrolase